MKILITGMTNRNSGRIIDYANHAPIFRDVFRDLGHEVDLRPLTVDDVRAGAKSYDHVLAFFSPVLDMHANDALLVTALLGNRSDGLWLGFDDWQFYRVWSGYGTLERLPKYRYDGVITGKRRGRDDFVGSSRLRNAFERGRKHWSKPSSGEPRVLLRPTLLTVFPWHQAREYKYVSLIDKPIFVDPSSYVELPAVERPARRARRHVLAVLGNHSRWVEKQKPTWPVDTYGYKAERLPEPVLVQRYAEARTVLAPRYPHAPVAWWRARYNFATHVRSILICDETDITQVKLPSYRTSVQEVEALNTRKLDELAEAQAREFVANTWSRETLLTNIKRNLRDYA